MRRFRSYAALPHCVLCGFAAVYYAALPQCTSSLYAAPPQQVWGARAVAHGGGGGEEVGKPCGVAGTWARQGEQAAWWQLVAAGLACGASEIGG